MSTFRVLELPCPRCGLAAQRSLAVSVNATRKPAFREEILAGTFQRFACAGCGAAIEFDGPFAYLDVESALFAWVQPVGREAELGPLEAEGQGLYDRCLGEGTGFPELVGKPVRYRLVFGLAALREKLLTARAGLDDALVEATKAQVIGAAPELLGGRRPHVRLVEVNAEALIFAGYDGRDPLPLAAARVGRGALAAISASQGALLEQLRAHPFVDLARLRLEGRAQ